MDWKGLLARFGLWVVRVLIREGRAEFAKRVVDTVVADPRVPEVGCVEDILLVKSVFGKFRKYEKSWK